MTAPADVPTTAIEIYKLLQPLDSTSRKLAIGGALAMLGETSAGLGKQKGNEEAEDADGGEYPAKASRWMKQNGITSDQLSSVFHDSEIIAQAIPGTHTKEKSVAIYVLTGVAALLKGGEPKFDDTTARDACKSHSCFDQANHAATIKKARNLFTGLKKLGYTLTAPGLKQGAELIKQIAQG